MLDGDITAEPGTGSEDNGIPLDEIYLKDNRRVKLHFLTQAFMFDYP